MCVGAGAVARNEGQAGVLWRRDPEWLWHDGKITAGISAPYAGMVIFPVVSLPGSHESKIDRILRGGHQQRQRGGSDEGRMYEGLTERPRDGQPVLSGYGWLRRADLGDSDERAPLHISGTSRKRIDHPGGFKFIRPEARPRSPDHREVISGRCGRGHRP